ncbi:hypothetical protein [Agrobacterium pusense]|uniref:hypothetical protein n=1 Tax=Agrobacterium pusense TaxID=648995 RepID=UPI000EDA5891|nr:hypothetical protein [Agrobacterium sp.]
MDKVHVDNLRLAYPAIWHDSAASLPNGWAGIVSEFLGDAADVGDLLDAVSCRFEQTASGLKVFCFPEMAKWTELQWTELHEAQTLLYKRSQTTCERCGQPGGLCQVGRATFFLCSEHGTAAREAMKAKFAAYEERLRFRHEVAVLFQDHSAVSLHASDHNFHILRQALRDIKKIVEERSLIGKVYVTKIEESEGQLFINVRCDQADPASQFELLDIVHHAQWKSDQAALAAGKESDDDAR